MSWITYRKLNTRWPEKFFATLATCKQVVYESTVTDKMDVNNALYSSYPTAFSSTPTYLNMAGSSSLKSPLSIHVFISFKLSLQICRKKMEKNYIKINRYYIRGTRTFDLEVLESCLSDIAYLTESIEIITQHVDVYCNLFLKVLSDLNKKWLFYGLFLHTPVIWLK